MMRAFAAWLIVTWTTAVLRLAAIIIGGTYPPYSAIGPGLPVWDDLRKEPPLKLGGIVGTVGPFIAGQIVVCLLFIATPIWIGWNIWRGSSVIIEAPATFARYRLVESARQVVVACAKASRRGGEQQPEALELVGKLLSRVEKDVALAYRSRGLMYFPRTHRRQELKQHAALVVGALHKAETQLDIDAYAALREISCLMLKIMRRYADGAIGALLDREQLEGVTPVQDRETLRVVAVATLFTSAAVGIALLHIPEATQNYLLSGVGGLIVAGLYGRRMGHGFDILDRFRR